MRERALSAVPAPVIWLLAGAFCAQLALKGLEPRPQARAADLPPAPPASTLRLLGLGEPLGIAQLLSLYLQAFDTQPGISIAFRELDYEAVAGWLDRVVDLDPAGQYPLLMASQVYTQVPDEARQRRMLAWVERRFREDPDRRWRWLAHAAILAKHRLHDLPLALQYAQEVHRLATGPSVPDWAKQMHIFLLEDMGERETAKILLGGLLASGTITDEHEMLFLTERLKSMGGPVEKSSGSSESRLNRER
ncbi:MAG TPA: hypothetical protein VHA15_14655 [Burkholderiales bacterium]|nr:hypothetical protein [Burkholderiales bacterium]